MVEALADLIENDRARAVIFDFRFSNFDWRGGRRWVRRRARERGRGRFIKGGEFVGAGEEEFEGAIEGTIALEADAGEAALDGVIESGGTFGRSGALKAEQGAEQGLGQGTGGQRSRNGIVVFPINRRMVVIRLGRNDNVRAGKIGTEGAQQFGDANKADGMEDVRVGELMQCGCICVCGFGFGRACIHKFHNF